MKINKLILEQLSSRDQSKLNSLKASGYSEISTRKYNSEPTKFDYETVGSGANIVYLAKPKVATNNNNNNNNNNNSGNNNNNNSSNNNNNNGNNQPPANTDLNDYVGKYKAEDGEESEVKIDGGVLKATVKGIAFKLTKTSKDLFDISGFGQTGRCEFLRDSSGKVVGVTAEIGTHSIKATKVGVTASTSGGSSSSSVPAINPQASSGSQITGSISGWPACVQRTQQKNIYIITDKKDIPVTYFKDQAGADDFLTKNTEKGYEIKKEACVFKFEDCDLDLQGPFSCEMYLRKNGTFISNGDYKIGQWKCSERNRVQYFDLQLSEEKIRKNIKKGLNKLIK